MPFLKCPETRCGLNCNGSEFQREGPAHENACRPKRSRLIIGPTTRAGQPNYGTEQKWLHDQPDSVDC